MKPTLNLDLDGVFANMNEYIRRNHLKDCPPKRMWDALGTIDHFFLNLEPLPNAKQFFNYMVNNTQYNTRILTSLPYPTGKFVTAKQDKTEWVRQHLSPSIEVVCVMGWRRKKDYIKTPDDVLVDDMFRNIDDWTNAGGLGVLHSHRDIDSTIDQLTQLGVFK